MFRLSHSLRVGSIGLCIVLAAACGGGSPPAPDTPAGSAITGGATVRSVEVDVGGPDLAEEEAQVLAAYGVPEMLQSGVTSTLSSRGSLSEDGRLDVRVTIFDFRLKTGASAFWLGSMAGADFLKVKVDVLEGGRSIRTFETDASTVLGGVMYASRTRRANRLAKAVSIRVADGV